MDGYKYGNSLMVAFCTATILLLPSVPAEYELSLKYDPDSLRLDFIRQKQQKLYSASVTVTVPVHY